MKGGSQKPPASAVQAFADYFNVSYGYFFGDANSISLGVKLSRNGAYFVWFKGS